MGLLLPLGLMGCPGGEVVGTPGVDGLVDGISWGCNTGVTPIFLFKE